LPIPSYEDWMTHTKLGVTRPRSLALRGVDNALADYHKGPNGKKASALRRALQSWIKEKGTSWRNNDRNRPPRRIITQLYDALNEMPDFSVEEVAALQFQEEERRKRLQLIFQNKKVVWKHGNAGLEARAASQALRQMDLSGRSNTGRREVHDQEAIEKSRKAAAQRVKERETYQPGQWTQGRDLFNAGVDIGLGVESVVSEGLVRPGIEAGFGTAGAAAGEQAFGEMLRGLFGGGVAVGEIESHLIRTAGLSTREILLYLVRVV